MGLLFPSTESFHDATDPRADRFLGDEFAGIDAFPLTGHTNPVALMAFSPDGRTLATAGDDNTVRLWDVALPHDLLRAVCDMGCR